MIEPKQVVDRSRFTELSQGGVKRQEGLISSVEMFLRLGKIVVEEIVEKRVVGRHSFGRLTEGAWVNRRAASERSSRAPAGRTASSDKWSRPHRSPSSGSFRRPVSS